MLHKKRLVTRVFAFILVTALISPFGAAAAATTAVQPRASAYLDSYMAYVYLPGDGEVRVYFNVEGTNYMDELGALFIELYESTDGTNWTIAKTFNHYSTAGMLSYNDDYHSGYVSYDGVDGRYYKAYVCVWGGKDGNGDARYFWTSVKPKPST